MTDDRSPDPSSHPQPRSGRRLFAGLLTGGILGGMMAASAAVFAHGHDGARWGGRCMHRMHGAASPEAMKERMAAGVDLALSRVNATDEQRVKVKTIMKEGMADIVSMRETHVANRETMLLSLAGETVDRDRLEAARRSEIEIAEKASVRMARMLADAAEVLTPEQRRSLADVLRRMRGPLGFGPGIPPDPHDGRHDPGRS